MQFLSFVICMSHNWYSNQFNILSKKAETSYNNASYKSNKSFINRRNCEVIDSMSTYCKNDMWTEITYSCRLRTVKMLQV